MGRVSIYNLSTSREVIITSANNNRIDPHAHLRIGRPGDILPKQSKGEKKPIDWQAFWIWRAYH